MCVYARSGALRAHVARIRAKLNGRGRGRGRVVGEGEGVWYHRRWVGQRACDDMCVPR